MSIILDNGIEGPQNTRFLQPEWESRQHKLDVLDLIELSGSWRESGVGLLLTAEPVSDRIMSIAAQGKEHDKYAVLQTNGDSFYEQKLPV